MRTRPRRLLLLAVVAVVVAMAGGAWLLWPRSAITRENAAKIRVGMTLVEVQTILGGPPRDETTGPFVLDPDFVEPAGEDWTGTLQGRWIDFMFVEPPRAPRRVMWHSDQVVIWVRCNAAGCVNACDHFPLRRAEESPLDMLRRWLRL